MPQLGPSAFSTVGSRALEEYGEVSVEGISPSSLQVRREARGLVRNSLLGRRGDKIDNEEVCIDVIAYLGLRIDLMVRASTFGLRQRRSKMATEAMLRERVMIGKERDYTKPRKY